MRPYLDQPRARTQLGALAPGALLYFFMATEDEPFSAYADDALTVPLPNPLIFDAGARCQPFYLDQNEDYRLLLTDADGNEIFDLDPFDGVFPGTDTLDPKSDDDEPLPLATLTFMLSGTTEVLATYTANSSGLFAPIDLNDEIDYRVKLEDGDGVLIYDIDPIPGPAPVPPPSGDPYFDDVVLLLHANGAQDSQVFTDSSSYGHTAIISNSNIDTTVKKYGSGSANFTGGAGGDQIAFAAEPEFSFETGDWTIELWALATAVDFSIRGLICKLEAAFPQREQFRLSVDATKLTLACYGVDGHNAPAVALIVDAINFPTDTWTHVAACRSGSSFLLWKDGVLVGSASSAVALGDNDQPLRIGNVNGATSQFFGYIDDVRLTKGIARYTVPFDPPTAQFPDFGP